LRPPAPRRVVAFGLPSRPVLAARIFKPRQYPPTLREVIAVDLGPLAEFDDRRHTQREVPPKLMSPRRRPVQVPVRSGPQALPVHSRWPRLRPSPSSRCLGAAQHLPTPVAIGVDWNALGPLAHGPWHAGPDRRSDRPSEKHEQRPACRAALRHQRARGPRQHVVRRPGWSSRST
jgi:hypothetical protein